ncbi:hypothetical protein, partial [Serratia sp. Se-RSmG]|uniref:hypothetical protein n=1 Tax=Serratia sp. Se-RSmG TaxID=3043307 RepID=UPI0024AF25EA
EENSETGGIKTLKCPANTIFSYLRLTRAPPGKLQYCMAPPDRASSLADGGATLFFDAPTRARHSLSQIVNTLLIRRYAPQMKIWPIASDPLI